MLPMGKNFAAQYHICERHRYALALLFVSISIFLYLCGGFSRHDEMFVTHDGAVAFYTFKYIYQSVIFDFSFPTWNFFTLFGQPMAYSYIAIGPTKIFSILFGYIFSIDNVLFLHKMSVFLDLFLMASGYILIARLYKMSVWAPIIVATGIGVCSNWFVDHYFGLRIFTIFPLVIYFILGFYENKKPSYIFIGGLYCAIMVFDGTVYLPFLYFYQFILLLLILFLLNIFKNIKIITEVKFFTPTNVATTCLIFALIAAFSIMLTDLISGEMIPYRNGRDPALPVTLEQFAAQIQVGKVYFNGFFGLLTTGGRSSYRFLLWGGSIVLIMGWFAVILAVFRRKQPHRAVTLGLFLFSAQVLLSTQGVDFGVTQLYHLLPGMVNYRFGMGLCVVAAVGFSVLAMFGLDHFLRRINIYAAFRSMAPWAVPIGLACLVISYLNIAGPWRYAASVGAELVSMDPYNGFIYLVLLVVVAVGLGIVVCATAIVNFYPYRYWLSSALGLILFIANLVSQLIVMDRDAQTIYNHNRVWSSFVSPHAQIVPLAFPTTRKDEMYKGLVYHHSTIPDQFPSFMAEPYKRSRSLDERSSKRFHTDNTSNNSLYQAGERVFTCVPWQDSVASTTEGEQIFRRFVGFDDEYMRGLVLGITGQQYGAARRVETDEGLRALLGCSKNVVRFADRPLVTGSHDAAAGYLKKHGGHRDSILILGEGDANQSSGDMPLPGSSTEGEIVGEQYWSDKIKFTVRNDASAPRWIIVTDTFHRRWRATINGETANIHVGNLSFKAISVPPGQSTVELRYVDPWADWAIWFAALAMLLSLLGFFAFCIRRICENSICGPATHDYTGSHIAGAR